MLQINIGSNIATASKNMGGAALQQLPFATARALTELARLAQAAEKKALPEVFDRPTPFTLNSIAVVPARKNKPIATVYVRGIAEKYLEPYEEGGTQFLGNKRSLFVPVKAPVNSYGNLPKNALAAYLSRSDCFVADVKTKQGTFKGLYQRPTVGKIKGKGSKLANRTNKTILLVIFEPPRQTTIKLRFGDRAQQVVKKNFNAIFGRELAKALATAR